MKRGVRVRLLRPSVYEGALHEPGTVLRVKRAWARHGLREGACERVWWFQSLRDG